MPASGFMGFDFTRLSTWAVLFAGVTAGLLVIVAGTFFGRWRWRRRLATASREEDLSWDELLEAMREYKVKQVPAGAVSGKEEEHASDEAMPSDELLQELLAGLSPRARRASKASLDEVQFVSSGGFDKRVSPRRWGNPTEVYLMSVIWVGRLHGLVINRSTGGLAILLDREVAPDTLIRVRSVEAPTSLRAVEAEVRHCRKVGKNFVLGCRFLGDIPWNVRVWFG